MPESLPKERRVPLNLPTMFRNYGKVISTRESLGYTIASGFMFGGLMSYISASEQLYHEVYKTGDMFALWFAGAASAMSVSNLINSRLVEKLGMRRMSHGALIGFVAVSAVHCLIALQGPVPFPLFYRLVLLAFFMIGFQGPNYNAIAMEPLGRLAGSGAALMGLPLLSCRRPLAALSPASSTARSRRSSSGTSSSPSWRWSTILVTERGSCSSRTIFAARLTRSGRRHLPCDW